MMLTPLYETVIGHLAITLENSLIRQEAYRRVLEENAPQLAICVDEAEALLQQSSPLKRRSVELRMRAIDAVRVADEVAVAECLADLRALAAIHLCRGRVE
jgi:hypothetical protein